MDAAEYLHADRPWSSAENEKRRSYAPPLLLSPSNRRPLFVAVEEVTVSSELKSVSGDDSSYDRGGNENK